MLARMRALLLAIAISGCGGAPAPKPAAPPPAAAAPSEPTPPPAAAAPASMAEQADAERRACEAGDQDSCAIYGGALMLGKGVDKDEVRGAELVKRSCEADNASGCELYARAFERGMGVAMDADAFHRYMHRACDLGAGGGCRSFALSFDNDDPQRIPFLEKACTLDDTIGCMGLGAAYLNGGQGVAKDLVKAKQYLQRACDMDPDKARVACQKASEL
jgi:uncharacterized protein